VKSIDLEALFRTGIDNALTVATWAEEVMHLLRLEGVSQVWSPKPAWYFWKRGAPGPYHFQLETTETRTIARESVCRTGLFSLRCYPYPDSGAFSTLREEERLLVKSHRFDETNTPRFENLDEIPRHLFQVAAIEYILGPEESWQLIAMESLAAREIGHPFFDLFVSLLCYGSRLKPVRLAVQASERIAGSCKDPRAGQRADEGGLRLTSTFMVLGNGHRKAWTEADTILDDELKREQATTLYDERFTPCCSGHAHGQMGSPFPVNDLWWTLTEKVFHSSITSTCGCK